MKEHTVPKYGNCHLGTHKKMSDTYPGAPFVRPSKVILKLPLQCFRVSPHVCVIPGVSANTVESWQGLNEIGNSGIFLVRFKGENAHGTAQETIRNEN